MNTDAVNGRNPFPLVSDEAEVLRRIMQQLREHQHAMVLPHHDIKITYIAPVRYEPELEETP